MIAGVPLECQEEEVLFDAPISALHGMSRQSDGVPQLQPSFDDKHLLDYGWFSDQELHVYDCPRQKDTSRPWAKRVLAASPVMVIDCVWSQDSSQLLYQTLDKEGNTQVLCVLSWRDSCAFASRVRAFADY